VAYPLKLRKVGQRDPAWRVQDVLDQWVWAILANVTRTSSPVGSNSAWRLAAR
jgi:hypothetical protein